MKSEIVCILDRSGSMYTIKSDAIGGYNTFIEEQKKVPGEATVTLVQFNSSVETVYAGIPLQDVPMLNDDTYYTSGPTALLNAVGRTIDAVGRRLAKMPDEERPDKVIIAILTDGLENASHAIPSGIEKQGLKRYTRSEINRMVTHQKEKYKWEFIFLAANQDAFSEASKLGIDSNDTVNFIASSEGIRDAYAGMTRMATAYRTQS
jgi:hypothetical protein